MDFNRILNKINAAGIGKERKLLKVHEMEVGKVYEIEKFKSIFNAYGRGIVCELTDHVAFFLPQRMAREINDETITQFNKLKMGVVLKQDIIDEGLPQIQLVPIETND
ncbi:hypothetical protein PPYR_05170 [Photinus pyralis]|uniref:Uncharacterized protein n=1 Tax=Photinus pyralis TaxID=7054 RepID=A0A5N4B082_PHOPY|nr:hypothetical protein PPYR_05170 [Photinus pyralis]